MTNVPLLSLMTHPLASTENATTAQAALAYRGVLLILGVSLCLAAVRLVRHILAKRTPWRLLAASCVVLTTVTALAVVAWRFYPIVASAV